ncbi:hypothetical protein [Curtobacterium flaccumfaciens]|uniref:hypothetical protein n=1 Tax=Curtobacterium flaccumfaciens TaxID=2035 RepID=UPI0026582AF6|nr:hypothetical protein [Curtobacterium flaccumfaciens]MCS5507135.1 hypothetical protein [Curtobacterium flaccumfaciens pv. flaccumfaciens]
MPELTALIGPAIAAVALVIGKLLDRGQARPSYRTDITADLKIWAALPASSPVRDELLADVERRVRGGIAGDEKTRDPFGIALGICFVLFGIWMGYLGITSDPVWLKAIFFGAATVTVVLGVSGIVLDSTKRERNQNK